MPLCWVDKNRLLLLSMLKAKPAWDGKEIEIGVQVLRSGELYNEYWLGEPMPLIFDAAAKKWLLLYFTILKYGSEIVDTSCQQIWDLDCAESKILKTAITRNLIFIRFGFNLLCSDVEVFIFTQHGTDFNAAIVKDVHLIISCRVNHEERNNEL